MKIELVLSKTYVCQGKVYNNGRAYEVSAKTAKHLLAQQSERNVPYFRKAADDAQAHLAPKKSITKGGIPIPVEDDAGDDTDAKPDPAEDDDAPKLDADGEAVEDEDDDGEDDADENEEAITV